MDIHKKRIIHICDQFLQIGLDYSWINAAQLQISAADMVAIVVVCTHALVWTEVSPKADSRTAVGNCYVFLMIP